MVCVEHPTEPAAAGTASAKMTEGAEAAAVNAAEGGEAATAGAPQAAAAPKAEVAVGVAEVWALQDADNGRAGSKRGRGGGKKTAAGRGRGRGARGGKGHGFGVGEAVRVAAEVQPTGGSTGPEVNALAVAVSVASARAGDTGAAVPAGAAAQPAAAAEPAVGAAIGAAGVSAAAAVPAAGACAALGADAEAEEQRGKSGGGVEVVEVQGACFAGEGVKEEGGTEREVDKRAQGAACEDYLSFASGEALNCL